MSISKVALHAFCLSTLNSRMQDAQAAIADTQKSANDDTKSSAGDKHETGRAMAQREVETRQKALAQLLGLRKLLLQINPEKECTNVSSGALLDTNEGIFYVASGIGKIKFEDQIILIVSFGAPLIQALKNCAIGKSITFNGKKWTLNGVS